MAAWQPGMAIAVKVVNVFDGNVEIGLPNHLANGVDASSATD
jgi:alanine dehydrogenase